MAEPRGRCTGCARYRRLWYVDGREIVATGPRFCLRCIVVLGVVARGPR